MPIHAEEPRERSQPRFLTLADVAEVLSTSVAQVRALVHSGELRYIQIGGRQQYRVETVELEKYIARMYAEADAKAAAPGTGTGGGDGGGDGGSDWATIDGGTRPTADRS